jgi:thermostable 8-oxoguanine DNA glycosylase
MEDDPGDKEDKKDEKDPLDKSGEEAGDFQHMEGQVRFTKDAPEELQQAQTTVDKLKEITDRNKTRDVARDVIDKLKGGLK